MSRLSIFLVALLFVLQPAFAEQDLNKKIVSINKQMYEHGTNSGACGVVIMLVQAHDKSPHPKNMEMIENLVSKLSNDPNETPESYVRNCVKRSRAVLKMLEELETKVFGKSETRRRD